MRRNRLDWIHSVHRDGLVRMGILGIISAYCHLLWGLLVCHSPPHKRKQLQLRALQLPRLTKLPRLQPIPRLQLRRRPQPQPHHLQLVLRQPHSRRPRLHLPQLYPRRDQPQPFLLGELAMVEPSGASAAESAGQVLFAVHQDGAVFTTVLITHNASKVLPPLPPRQPPSLLPPRHAMEALNGVNVAARDFTGAPLPFSTRSHPESVIYLLCSPFQAQQGGLAYSKIITILNAFNPKSHLSTQHIKKSMSFR